MRKKSPSRKVIAGSLAMKDGKVVMVPIDQLPVKVDPLKPPVQLLVKLGSALVHADEFMSPDGHPFDKQAFEQLMRDEDLKAWIAQMTGMGLLPVKR